MPTEQHSLTAGRSRVRISDMRLPEIFDVDRSALSSLCTEYGVTRLAVFGSVLRGRLRPDSDIDLLVEFEPTKTTGLLRVAELELRLGELFSGREVEIRTYEDLSRYFRDEVRHQAVSLFEAA